MDTDDVEVRRLAPADDWQRVRALRLEMLEDTPLAYAERWQDAHERPPAYWQERLRQYTKGESRITFVAEQTGRWVGQAGGTLIRASRADLVSVYIAPPHRGTGLLERLTAEVVTWAVDRGCDTLGLEVAQENTRAVAAYTRLGFRPTGRSQPHPIYPDSVEIEMARSLAGTAHAQSGP